MRTIPQIDKDITAVAAQVTKLGGVKPRSAGGWQKLWDRFPELAAETKALYRERGAAQVVRDEAAYRASIQAARKARRKTRRSPLAVCPTCGRAS